jgi:hypothetical protein
MARRDQPIGALAHQTLKPELARLAKQIRSDLSKRGWTEPALHIGASLHLKS